MLSLICIWCRCFEISNSLFVLKQQALLTAAVLNFKYSLLSAVEGCVVWMTRPMLWFIERTDFLISESLWHSFGQFAQRLKAVQARRHRWLIVILVTERPSHHTCIRRVLKELAQLLHWQAQMNVVVAAKTETYILALKDVTVNHDAIYFEVPTGQKPSLSLVQVVTI